jgi:hypothetical protein
MTWQFASISWSWRMLSSKCSWSVHSCSHVEVMHRTADASTLSHSSGVCTSQTCVHRVSLTEASCCHKTVSLSCALHALLVCQSLVTRVLLLQESYQEEMKLLRSGLLTAETHRDQLLLRLQALQSAASASSDIAMKEALAQDTQAAAAAAEGPPSSPTAAARAAAEAAVGGSGGAGGGEAPAAGLLAEVGVVQSLRARVAELETELRQVRTMACAFLLLKRNNNRTCLHCGV